VRNDVQRVASISILFFLGLTSMAFQGNLEDLKKEADRAEGGRQAKLCSELAEYLVGVAGQQFTRGSTQQAQVTVEDILKYAQKAHDAALKSRSNMKQTEVRLRETQRRLETLKRTLVIPERPPLDAVEKKIDQFRQDLLDAMFSPKRNQKA
jgi:hypothetical protein